MPEPRLALIVLGLGLALAGCAGRRIVEGVYHSPHGYRITLPGATWALADGGSAEVELVDRATGAAMVAHASCEAGLSGRSLPVLLRYPLFGLRERTMLEEGEVSLNGRRAAHALVEGRMRGAEDRVKVELYVMKHEGCVYDLLYAAPPERFDEGRAAFQRFVETFRTE